MQFLFPELLDKVIPTLRESKVKFRKPAKQSISAHSSVSDEDISVFRDQFSKQGKSAIKVTVEIKDLNNIVTCSGVFKWFVQQLVDEV